MRSFVPARAPFVLVASIALAACMSAEPDPASTPEPSAEASDEQDLISIGNLIALVRGNVDRSAPDPYNEWAKKKLAVGEENRLPEEDAEFLRLGELVNRFQTEAKAEANEPRLARAFHAKSHACLQGTLTIDNGQLPELAKVGLFAQNATYPTWARFSNGLGTKQADRKLDVRGFAFKIMGTSGTRVVTNPGDDTATTQDFLLANLPFAPHSTATTMMAFGEVMSASKQSNTILGKIDGLLGVGKFLASNENVRLVDFLANHALAQTKASGSLLSETFFSGAPSALGVEDGNPATAKAKGAMKWKARAGVLEGNVCKTLQSSPNKEEGFLRNDFKRQLAAHDLCIDLSIQRQEDGEKQSIEDVSVLWQTPYVNVGRLVFTSRTLTDGDADETACNEFSFQPWHTLAAHRPLGNAMRARRIALPSSAKFRGASTPEPTAAAAQ